MGLEPTCPHLPPARLMGLGLPLQYMLPTPAKPDAEADNCIVHDLTDHSPVPLGAREYAHPGCRGHLAWTH